MPGHWQPLTLQTCQLLISTVFGSRSFHFQHSSCARVLFLLMARASQTRRTWCATRIWLVVPTAWAFHSMLPLLFVPPASPSIQHGAKKAQRNLRTPGPLQPLGPWAALLTPVAAHAEDPQGGDWFEPFVDINAKIIEGIDGVVGSAGFAIVLYTIIIKVATFPLQQPALRTSALMQLLSPQTDEIERRYPLDEEGRGRTLRELYGKVGLNPFAAFLPILFQLPVFIALFRAIGKLASQDEHFKEGSKTVGCCRVAEVCRHRSVRFASFSPDVRSLSCGSPALQAQLPAEGALLFQPQL